MLRGSDVCSANQNPPETLYLAGKGVGDKGCVS